MPTMLQHSYQWLRPVYERSSLHRGVIEEVDDPGLQKAYAHCRQVTRRHAKTFYMATRFLPRHKQRGIFAIYALCRYLDDLVDEAEDLWDNRLMSQEEVRSKLEHWKIRLRDTYDGYQQTHPVLMAFADVLRRYHIPIELPYQLMEGVCSDMVRSRIETFDELYDYSYKVASIVGLMTSAVFGYETDDAIPCAIDLGIAMQLTNILRDIGEDLDRGRIYLPREDLDRFGVTEQSLFERRMDRRYVELMRFQVERARRYYQSADQGIPMLEADSQLPVYLARYNYSRILDKIEQRDYRILNQRVYLTQVEKMAVIPKAWMQLYLL